MVSPQPVHRRHINFVKLYWRLHTFLTIFDVKHPIPVVQRTIVLPFSVFCLKIIFRPVNHGTLPHEINTKLKMRSFKFTQGNNRHIVLHFMYEHLNPYRV